MPQHPNYSPPILGVDPGKQGGFCLMSADGRTKRFWVMPLTGGKVCGTAIASLYNEIKSLCREPPKVFIEKVQAMKHDGKVGMSSYFKGAGLLEMCRLWQWPVVLVPPGTWCSKMHAGIDGKLHPKDKSRVYVSQHWPELYAQGSDLWPGRTKHPHEGLMDALMIAEFGRKQTYR